jgi:hypothetical protein
LIQQDAVRKLFGVITNSEVDLTRKYSDLAEVRDLRIRVAGHPVGGRGASHFLVRHSVSKWGFELWAFDERDEHTRRTVNLLSAVEKNLIPLTHAMHELIAFVEAQSFKHKQEYAEESVAQIFRHSSYFSSKISEGISRDRHIGLIGVDSVFDLLREFRSTLEKRSDHFREADFVTHDGPELEYALTKLKKYFESDATQTEQDARIVAQCVRVGLAELAKIAKEIDEDYKVAKLHEETGK